MNVVATSARWGTVLVLGLRLEEVENAHLHEQSAPAEIPVLDTVWVPLLPGKQAPGEEVPPIVALTHSFNCVSERYACNR